MKKGRTKPAFSHALFRLFQQPDFFVKLLCARMNGNARASDGTGALNMAAVNLGG